MDGKLINAFKDFCMCLRFVYEMARDVHQYFHQERISESRMLFRL